MDGPEKFDPKKFSPDYIKEQAKGLIESLELEKTEPGREMSGKKEFVVVIKNSETGRLILETNPKSEQEARLIVEEMKEKHPNLDVEIKK